MQLSETFRFDSVKKSYMFNVFDNDWRLYEQVLRILIPLSWFGITFSMFGVNSLFSLWFIVHGAMAIALYTGITNFVMCITPVQVKEVELTDVNNVSVLLRRDIEWLKQIESFDFRIKHVNQKWIWSFFNSYSRNAFAAPWRPDFERGGYISIPFINSKLSCPFTQDLTRQIGFGNAYQFVVAHEIAHIIDLHMRPRENHLFVSLRDELFADLWAVLTATDIDINTLVEATRDWRDGESVSLTHQTYGGMKQVIVLDTFKDLQRDWAVLDVPVRYVQLKAIVDDLLKDLMVSF